MQAPRFPGRIGSIRSGCSWPNDARALRCQGLNSVGGFERLLIGAIERDAPKVACGDERFMNLPQPGWANSLFTPIACIAVLQAR